MWKWLLSCFLFVGLAPLSPELDIGISSYYYHPDTNTFTDNAYFQFFFKYGEIIGFLIGSLACGGILVSWFYQKWKKFLPVFLTCILTLVIGAGLITNVLLKGYWGRPRPKQIVEFGGKHIYRPFWKPDFHTRHDPQKSFPSGHVAMGVYYVAFFFAGRRYQSRLFKNAGAFLTIFFGINLIFTRLAQGGHFFSDIFFSIVLIWYIALISDYLLWRFWQKKQSCKA